MKKMFTLLALTLIVSMATFAQKPLYGTAATPSRQVKLSLQPRLQRL